MASSKCLLCHHTSILKHIPAVPTWEEPHRRRWAAAAGDITESSGPGLLGLGRDSVGFVDELRVRIARSRIRALLSLEASALERTPYIYFFCA